MSASDDKSAEGPTRSAAAGGAKVIDKSAEEPTRNAAAGGVKVIDSFDWALIRVVPRVERGECVNVGAIVALAGDPAELRRRVVAAWHRLADAVPITFAVGHCFGGLAALELARAGTHVRAVVSLHGGLTTSAPATAIRARILAVCGAADAFCPPDQRAAFEAEMTAAGADWQLLVLGGAQHGFSIPDIAPPACAYDTVADRRSWRAMLALFEDTMIA